ncbi:MAG TPA: hypothetical protein VJG67_02805 [Candidatus Paceibacterota bacterium]
MKSFGRILTSWFSAAVIWKIEDGVLWIMVQQLKSTHPLYAHNPAEVKMIGGTNTDHPEDGDPLATLRRELKDETADPDRPEETGLIMRPGFVPEVIYEPPATSSGHQKFFYLVPWTELTGEIRTVPIKDGDDEVSVPRWERADELHRVLYRTHQAALHWTVQRLIP